MFNEELRKHLSHNFTVNVMDGAFFGLAMGFASSVTVMPLFIDSLSDSTALIGLIASLQIVGWNLPQLFTSNWVAKLRRYLPMVMFMTLHERWPFLGLAAVAYFVSTLGNTWALILTFIMLCWAFLGGGFTATAWQSMISKIIPVHRRGTFWGTQSAAVSIGIAIGGFTAGKILEAGEYPYDFALCFLLSGIAMMISMVFIGWTREPEFEIEQEVLSRKVSFAHFLEIWRSNANLRRFIAVRALSNFGHMATAFYTIYGVRQFDMNPATAGVMLAVMTAAQTIAGPAFGWWGDKIGHRRTFAIGLIAMGFSALLALSAQSVAWLYPAFLLAGIGHNAFWTIAMTMTVEFGTDQERPYIIGLVNTLIGPAALIAPLFGGWLVDASGFSPTFALAASASFITAAILLFIIREPVERRTTDAIPVTANQVGD